MVAVVRGMSFWKRVGFFTLLAAAIVEIFFIFGLALRANAVHQYCGTVSGFYEMCQVPPSCAVVSGAGGGNGGGGGVPCDWYSRNRQANGSGETTDGDPVDVGTGAHAVHETFGMLPGRFPFALSWTFRSLDGTTGPMGIGTSLSTDIYMLSDNSSQTIRLFTPGNKQFLFTKQSGDANVPMGVYTDTIDPEMLGTKIEYQRAYGNPYIDYLRWTVKGGTTYIAYAGSQDNSLPSYRPVGWVYSIQDRFGHGIEIKRIPGKGYPTEIAEIAPSGQTPRKITLTYGNPNNQLQYVDLPLTSFQGSTEPARRWQILYGTTAATATGRAAQFAKTIDPSGASTRYTWLWYQEQSSSGTVGLNSARAPSNSSGSANSRKPLATKQVRLASRLEELRRPLPQGTIARKRRAKGGISINSYPTTGVEVFDPISLPDPNEVMLYADDVPPTDPLPSDVTPWVVVQVENNKILAWSPYNDTAYPSVAQGWMPIPGWWLVRSMNASLNSGSGGICICLEWHNCSCGQDPTPTPAPTPTPNPPTPTPAPTPTPGPTPPPNGDGEYEDGFPLIECIYDRTNNERLHNYYSLGKVIGQSAADGGFTTIGYSAGSTTFTDHYGNPVKYTFASNGASGTIVASGYHVVSVSDVAMGRTTTVLYGNSGNFLPSGITDPDGRTALFTYDSHGNVTAASAPAPSGATLSYTATYDPTYDIATQTTDPLGTTNVTLNSNGLPQYIQRDGSPTIFLYYTPDYQLDTIKAADPWDISSYARVTQFTYTPRGEVSTAKSGAMYISGQYVSPPATTQYFYDDASRVRKVIDPTGESATVTLNVMDQTTKVARTTGSLNQTLAQYGYDVEGRLQTLTNGMGYAWTFAYDKLDRAIKTTNPLGQYQTASYGKNGEVLETVDALGQKQTSTYIKGRRLQNTVYKSASGTLQATRTYTYNTTNPNLLVQEKYQLPGFGTGNLQTANYTYDSWWRLRGMTTTGTSADVVQAWDYDDFGRTTATSQNNAPATTYGYNPTTGRLSAIHDPASGDFTYGYNVYGQLATSTEPGGVTHSKTFTPRGDLDTATTTRNSVTLFSRSYDHDIVGRIISETVPGTSTVNTFHYDAFGRLDAATKNGISYAYGFDMANNRISESVNGVTRTFTYNAANRLTSVTNPSGTLSAQHDANGNLIQLGSDTLAWNHRGLLASVTSGGTVTSYSYDLFGRRTGKKVGTSDSRVYRWDGARVAAGVGPGIFAATRGLDNHYKVGGAYPVKDHLGSVLGLVNESGQTVQTQNFDPYGQVTASTSTSDYANQPYAFTGLEQDGNGLVYARNRYYAPGLGRFISEDPIGFGGGINFYAYCGGDPVNFTDPLGLEPEWFNGQAGLGALAGMGDLLSNGAVSDPTRLLPGVALYQDASNILALGRYGYRCGWQKLGGKVWNGVVDSFNFWDEEDPYKFGHKFGTAALTAYLAADAVAEGVAARNGGGGCFVAGTTVTRGDGKQVAIETVKKGDTLLARNEGTGKTEARIVKRTSKIKSYALVTIEIADATTGEVVDTITGTPNHPFWVPGKGWVPLGKLGIGTSLVTRAGPSSGHLVVKSSRWESHPEGVWVYNFIVDGFHTYFVGTANGGIWVHNGLEDCTHVYRGGEGATPEPGKKFSGQIGTSHKDAGQHLPHGQVQAVGTVGEIRAGGGTVDLVPEEYVAGIPIMNEGHVNVTLGEGYEPPGSLQPGLVTNVLPVDRIPKQIQKAHGIKRK